MVSPRRDHPFSELGAHPSAAGALAARGYDTPTPVQKAVLAAPDRDLLVSAETGSGKTVAFGLLMARALCGDNPAMTRGEAPGALVVAPTRELAAQVQRELDWLLAPTGARTVAFTGGTDLRLDSRALHRGVEVVVGTPGRLVDLVSRKSLDLSQLKVIVLDEADEMLDLGFRESLETLLDTAPKERRTLLFSATLPSGIRTLAKRYQVDPLSIDPRQGATAPHSDIHHIAHICKHGERLGALVNVLRVADEERAIVFCRTRDRVSEIHRQLSIRGFLATAISGERAQTERTRALEALRQGRVRVLVATNVAARGLDLPDLSLVVHADLPDNADSLTHRSGRTGRAGKKGVNVFLVEENERRRAERLFAEAHLKLKWSAAPSAEAIAEHDREQLRKELDEVSAPPSVAAHALATQLIATHDPSTLIATLIDRALAGRPAGEVLTPIELTRFVTAPKKHTQAGGDMVVFQVNLGIKDRAEANWILPLICRRGDITRREVGAIRVDRDRTYFEIASASAAAFAANAAETDPRAPHVRIGPADAPMPARSFPTRPAGRPPMRPAAGPPVRPHVSDDKRHTGHAPPTRPHKPFKKK